MPGLQWMVKHVIWHWKIRIVTVPLYASMRQLFRQLAQVVIELRQRRQRFTRGDGPGIARLDVAMDDAELVTVLDSIKNLQHHNFCLLLCQFFAIDHALT